MKYKLIVLTVLLTAFLLVNLHFNGFKNQVSQINKVFPYKIADWNGKDQKIDESVFTMLDKGEILMRLYKNSKNNRNMSLAIVLTDKRDHIHDPEVCYRGQGIDMYKETIIPMSPQDKARLVFGKKNKNRYDIIYWYTDLKKNYASRVDFLKQVTISRFLDKPFNGYALIVIIAPEINGENKTLIDFANKVSNNLNKAQ